MVNRHSSLALYPISQHFEWVIRLQEVLLASSILMTDSMATPPPLPVAYNYKKQVRSRRISDVPVHLLGRINFHQLWISQ